MDEFGLHLMLDLGKCSKKKLVSQSYIYDILNELPEKIGMHKMTLPHVYKWKDKFSTSDQAGITGVVTLAESHATIHTFPDYNFVFIDVFSCKSFDTDKAIRLFKKYFGAKDIKPKVETRGVNFPKKVYKS